jgi:PAS domain S-box-containing protein
MERIKQNLRLRSGRTKKTTKKVPTAQQVQKQDDDKELPHRPIWQPQQQRTISAQGGGDGPSLGNWDQDTALPQMNRQKPQLIPKEFAAPQPNGIKVVLLGPRPKPPKDFESTRYGRSGIERKQFTMPQESKQQKMGTSPSSSEQNFDLRVPQSKPRPTSLDTLCEMLFSEGHLNILIHDPSMMARFSAFLQRYKPGLSAVVLQYLEYQKAIKAIEYANAVAESITPVPAIEDADGLTTPTKENADPHSSAAELSKPFAETSKRAYDLLVHEALPAYVTYTLVKLSTECLIAEVTSHSPTTLTSNLIGGLSEVFCLSDPTLPDNPLIYCSEEFYRLTGYTSGDVLGQNCRFLQGPKTDQNSVRRISEAVRNGKASNETILNYRRDGRGFVNVLMISPLEDDKGKVKYFLGAQIDVSRLVAGGWGLDGLERLVQKREMEEIRGRRIVKGKKDGALRKLRELSEMFDLEESVVVRSHSRGSSLDRSEIGSGATSAGSDRPKQARRVFGDDKEEASGSDEDGSGSETEATEKEKSAWKLATTGSSGKLPGVYQKYLLIRPAPSLRIIFVSPALRKKGNIGQKPFLSHIAAPSATLAGLKESFESGTPVTAKVAFMVEPGGNRNGTATGRWNRSNSKGKNDQNGGSNDTDPGTFGRTCWISATPLLGGDDEVGVWMVVLVDKKSAPSKTLSKTKGQGMQHQQLEGRAVGIVKAGERNEQIQLLSNDIRNDDIPIRPTIVGGTSANGTPRKPESPSPPEDREAAREMYDNDGNEAVQQEASQDASDSVNDKSHAHEEDNPLKDAKDEDEFEKVPNKASSIDDENLGPGPAENEKDEHHTPQNDENLEEELSPKETINEDEDETFVRRNSNRPTSSNTKERVVIRNDSSSDVEREVDVDTAANDSFPGKHDADEEESTPTKARYDLSHGDEGNDSRPGTSSSNAPLYMDYLRHPGTRDQRKKKEGGATPSDPDCDVWSPYSVD